MKKNNIIIAVILLIIIGVGGYMVYSKNRYPDPGYKDVEDYRDASYLVDGRIITLKNGFSDIEAAPGSDSRILTRYFGSEVKHDLDGDGTEDVAFILVQDMGGSGTFYYVVAALNKSTGYVGSEAFLLGDRIAPQTTGMDEGETVMGTKRQNVIVVNYAVRFPGEPFSVQPSLGKSVWLKLDPVSMQFAEVAQNFEGESK